MVEDKKKAMEEAKKADEERSRKAHEAEMHKRRTDTNYNPLLQNGITNKDIFRTLLFHFHTDNFLRVNDVATFVKNLLKRPINNTYDQ